MEDYIQFKKEKQLKLIKKESTMKSILNFFKQILHFLPFVHFYGKWEDINEITTHGHNHQIQRCTVCNKARKRWYDSSAFL